MAETLLPGEGKHRKLVRAAGFCPEIADACVSMGDSGRAHVASRGCVGERFCISKGRRCCFFKCGGQAHAATQPGMRGGAVLQLD